MSDEFTHRGWKARWTGWKDDLVGTDLIVAQWFATSEESDMCLYVNSPGSWGPHLTGTTADFDVHFGLSKTREGTVPELLDSIKTEMRMAMVRLIESVNIWPERFAHNPS